MNGAVWAAHCIGRGGRGIRHRHEIGHLDACSDKQRIFDMSDSSEATINQDHPPWFQISDASDCRPANAALTVSPFFPPWPWCSFLPSVTRGPVYATAVGKEFRLGTVSMATRWNFSILLLVTSTARAESKRMQPSEQGARFAALRTLCADKTCVCMAAARPLVFAHCLPWAVASVTSGRGVQSDSSERVSYSGVVAALLGRLLTTATSRRR